MYQLSFERRLQAGNWIPVEVDCLSFERKGTGVELRLGERKYSLVEPVRNLKVFSTAELLKKEARWRDGTEGEQKDYKAYIRSENNILAQAGIDDGAPEEPVDPDILICSFCRKKVSRINATIGVGRLSIAKELKVVSNDPLVEQLVTTVSAPKVTACLDCCLMVKPILNRDGTIAMQNCSTYSEG